MPDPAETPLSPVFFLERAALYLAARTAIIDGDRSFTYREFGERAHRLAGMLAEAGIGPGDRVAALCTNSHVLLELHNGVPMAGAVLVPINIRLSESEIATILGHSGARLLVATEELAASARAVARTAGIPVLVAGSCDGEYERRLAASSPHPVASIDEWAMLSLNYTSGSTGRPKGVMCCHRGAYLQSMATAYHARLALDSAYLWTLPMFHCNGWCFTWAVTAAGATHVCRRRIDPADIWRTLCDGGATHLSAAPTVLTMIAEAADAEPGRLPACIVEVGTGGAPPPPALLSRLARLRIRVTHLYGLTETYGPAVINEWQPEWSERSAPEQARLNARQGIPNVATHAISVIDPQGCEVPSDGTTLGEIAVRGNNVMLGYFRDEEATRASRLHGWFRTGDLGVRHPDGYIELKDRAKDIIITGGENVASVEVEKVLAEHPAVLEAAVAARPDRRWGEVPVAFVVLRPGSIATESELIDFVRDRVAHFKAPKEIRFEELPKTSTGKVQKHLLRRRLAEPSGKP